MTSTKMLAPLIMLLFLAPAAQCESASEDPTAEYDVISATKSVHSYAQFSSWTAKEIFDASDLVASCEVSEIVESGMGYSTVKLAVNSVYKGELDGPIIGMRVPGGPIGNLTLWVEDTPTFKVGETPLLFLGEGSSQDDYRVLARSFVYNGYAYGSSVDSHGALDTFLLPLPRALTGSAAQPAMSDSPPGTLGPIVTGAIAIIIILALLSACTFFIWRLRA